MTTPNRVLVESRYAQTKLGYYPDIMNPKSFSEHVLNNKMFVKNDLLVQTTDKVAVNEYVKDHGFEEILIENYHITDDPDTIPFDKLPDEYIIKPVQYNTFCKTITAIILP